jgi:hypothetical protein
MLQCLNQLSPGKSPFDRLVAFDVYDGPATGVVFCRESGEAGLFRLLAWDDRQRRRVFEVSPIDSSAVADLVTTLSETQVARWPEWWLAHLPTESEERKAAAAIARAVATVNSPSHIIVSEDLLGEIADAAELSSDDKREIYRRMNVRSTPDAEVTDTSFDEWVAFVRAMPRR